VPRDDFINLFVPILYVYVTYREENSTLVGAFEKNAKSDTKLRHVSLLVRPSLLWSTCVENLSSHWTYLNAK